MKAAQGGRRRAPTALERKAAQVAQVAAANEALKAKQAQAVEDAARREEGMKVGERSVT